jgi:4-hydroxybenzoyl-CoA thioesterase
LDVREIVRPNLLKLTDWRRSLHRDQPRGMLEAMTAPSITSDTEDHAMEHAMPFECDKLIRFHHCDPAGIVFYPQYFILFHEVVEDWFSNGLGIDYAHFISEQRLGLPIGRVECDFLALSKIGDVLRMGLAVGRIGTSSLQLHFQAEADGQARVRAKISKILVSLDKMRAVPFPDELRRKVERFLA